MSCYQRTATALEIFLRKTVFWNQLIEKRHVDCGDICNLLFLSRTCILASVLHRTTFFISKHIAMYTKLHTKSHRWLTGMIVLVLFFSACQIIRDNIDNLVQVNLVANNGDYSATRVDANFTDPWGFDFSPFGPAFISSNATGTSPVIGTIGDERRSPIAIPGPGEIPGTGKPTGVVFNNTDNFQLNTNFSPARFIYAGSDGIISGWNEGDAASVIIDHSANASYTGLAIAQNAGANFLYVANFKENKVEVYDGTFTNVASGFTDASIPAGYAPYNIKNIEGLLYVTYARGTNGVVEPGAGRGYINVFSPDGSLNRRFASGGRLNAPWGITKASPSFGNNSTTQLTILVGNYGDGRINSYSQFGTLQGTLQNSSGNVSIPGLRAIGFAPDSVLADNGKLFFTAGPANRQDGLFGYLQSSQP